MKIKNLVAACAVAAASFSATTTMAAAPATPFETPATLIDVYLTGASAPQNILGALAATLFGANSGVGVFNNYHVIYDNGVSGAVGASYRAYYGQLQAAHTIGGVTLPAGTPVRLTDRAKGGSVFGVNPVARSQTIAWMPITAGNCVAAPAGLDHNFRCGEAGNDITFPATGRISDFGVSDVEPAMFKGPYNVEFGQNELAPNELNRLQSFATSGLLFGLPATVSVPPTISFNKSVYSSLLSGIITDWTALDPTLTGNTQVVVCRRVQGSGTQATYNAHYNNFPCTAGSVAGSGVLPPLRMADSAGYSEPTPTTISVDPSAGLTVIENPSSGNVRTCMQRAQIGGNHTFTSDDGRAVTVNFGAGGYRAIGTLSLDSPSTPDYTHRELAGQLPTKANLRTGQYGFYSELSMQYRGDGYVTFNPATLASSFVSGSPGAGSIDQRRRAFINLFINRAGDPAILNQIASVPLRNATAALPINFTPGEANLEQQNTMYVTQFGNSCSPAQRIQP
ncbi:MAG TPA: hypothetical protein VJS66_01320 [Burkholderiales bacterium]|nr:hypothetical protein [Burkholderiales bacterium]